MSYEHVVIERVKGFLKWNAHRFENLDDKAAAVPMEPIGWERSDEFWVKPVTWLDLIHEADGAAAQHAARVLRDMGLLRTQTVTDSLQCSVKVRGACVRAYAVSREILDKRPVTGDGRNGHRSAELEPAVFDKSQFMPTPTNSATSADPNADPNDPAALLQQGVIKGLRMAIDTLDMQLDPSDRNYGALLRAKTALANNLIATQVRVDEARLRARQSDVLIPELLEKLKVERERLAALPFRRTLD